MKKNEITWADFEKIDLRAGRIVGAERFPEARRPAYKLWIDLGERGVLRSSAQITDLYETEDLVGRTVLCVVNFPPKQIGPWISECLVTGFYRADGKVVLVTADLDIEPGAQLG